MNGVNGPPQICSHSWFNQIFLHNLPHVPSYSFIFSSYYFPHISLYAFIFPSYFFILLHITSYFSHTRSYLPYMKWGWNEKSRKAENWCISSRNHSVSIVKAHRQSDWSIAPNCGSNWKRNQSFTYNSQSMNINVSLPITKIKAREILNSAHSPHLHQPTILKNTTVSLSPNLGIFYG